jgi:hypothetical protein
MKIIWCAEGFTARVSDEPEGYVHFAYRETREREKRDFMTDLKFVSWKEIFPTIMDETDPDKLARLVPEAELAIFKRQQTQLPRGHKPSNLSPLLAQLRTYWGYLNFR